ncbi:ComE operon protein 2 [Bacillus spongiae]|uniref:ComE operon protein 2 n=1 Tax=Bacillus spongiae TaxID=2683610 RepID=A0ABU8H9B8_9BACI
MNRISWNEYFMAQSHLLSLRSTCTRLAVGATIVRDKRVIAGGYNGSITGGDHCIDHGCYVIDNHCVRTIHAEMNAVLQCAKFGVPTEGAEIYVTHFPCLQCAKSIIQAGIQTVYYAQNYKNHPYTMELFNLAGVTVQHVPFQQNQLDPQSVQKEELVNELLLEVETNGTSDESLSTLKKRALQLFSS